MRIDGLSLDFFRNYVHLDAAFDPNINVIYGDNAQGKTNLLEAVAYLSGVSHRARYDRELIQFGVDHAFLKGNVFAQGSRVSAGGGVAPGSAAGAAVQRRQAEKRRRAVRYFSKCAVLPGGPVSDPGRSRQPGGAFWMTASASCGPGTPWRWRSISGSTSTRPAF